MRSYLFFLLFFGISLVAHGQLTRGTQFINTSANSTLGVTKTSQFGTIGIDLVEDELDFRVLLSPNYGRFLSDHFVLGGGLTATLIGDFSESFHTYGANLFGRYYFNPASANNYFFTQAGSMINVVEGADDPFYGIEIGAGWTHFLAPAAALDLTLNYLDGDLSTPGNQWLQLGAGLNLFLPSGTWRERQSTVAGFSRGSWMIGGTTGGLNFWPEDGRATYLSLSPNVAYFLADRISVGTNILFDYYRYGRDGKRVSTGIMPVGRFYGGQANNRTWFISTGFEWSRQRIIPNEGPSAHNDTYAMVGGIGSNIFITPNVAMEIGPVLRYLPEENIVQLNLLFGAQVFLNPAPASENTNR
jgi:hypothetical protein